ncbi:transcription factor Adf-1-like isoform X2 [Simochromis diagramma]|uniref:transcription factor Adf-1-like isoform X2 n=1 Tax=Simochromis diagramma TaxID=43689 RepID=UPI001A7E233C|nr:transcription factor Adf-1-like isoform X2 [Simochromis diagramma]
MEEKLISAMANHPELYDASYYFYRDRNKKDLAWRHISEEIRQPEDICRRKWKSLRDTYNKEKRTEKEKRSGSAAGSGRRWKFFGHGVCPKRQQGSVSQKSQVIMQQSPPLSLLLAPQTLVPQLLLLHPQAHRGG